MSFLKEPFQYGKIVLPNNIFYAPLAGCSDFPFRQMSANPGENKIRPGLFFCEMVKMDALIRNDVGTYHILDYEGSMHPIGAQLCGAKKELAGPSAKILEDLGFDVIDLNCGCPVDKVTKDGSGSGLLKNPQLIGELISEIVNAVKVPVTVKIRAGWDEKSIQAAEIAKIAEEAGATAICIHGRTRAQGYKGPANWDWIRQAKDATSKILVVGNGDLYTADDVKACFSHTGCDAVLVARGTLGAPDIADQIIRSLRGEALIPSTISDCREALLAHFEHTVRYHSPRRAVLDLRRIGCWYLKKSVGTRAFREKISKASSLEEVRALIYEFPLEEIGENGDQEEGFCEEC